MDPHIRWLRRLVIARAAERVTIESSVVGLMAGLAAGFGGWQPADVATGSVIATMAYAVLRLGLAVSTNPINHRYLLRWTDPAPRLLVTVDEKVRRNDDPVGDELRAGGFRYLARLERGDAAADGSAEGTESVSAIDLYRAEGGRLVVARGDDGEVTIISRLADDRTLVTAASLVPPTEQLLVQRCGGDRGQIATDAVIDHVERLLQLRADGVEATATEPADVVTFLHAEWQAWQELGPFIGPLIALRPRRGRRLALQIAVPDDLVRDRALRRVEAIARA